MKKFFIALSVLAALMLSVVPSQALVGMPDDVPGCDAVVPFVCDISGTTGLNTLIVFTDIGGGFTARNIADFHYTIYTVRSATVYDDWVDGTARDIVSTDGFTEVAKMAPAIRKQLEVDIDGDGAADHYAGYIIYERLVNLVNTVVGQYYLVDLPNGIAAASNIPMKERVALPAAFQAQMAPVRAAIEPWNSQTELFSADALFGAQLLQAGFAAPLNANGFGIYPRFFIQASGDVNWIFIWKSLNAVPGLVHVDFYDNAENLVSSNLPLDRELVILDVEPYIPVGLIPAATYPKEGFIDLEWDLSPAGATAAQIAALRNLEVLGWTWQAAVSGTGALNWTALTPMWRDVSFFYPF